MKIYSGIARFSCDSTAFLSAAATSCKELYERGLEDNTYVTIDADGSGLNEPFTAYCELNGSTAYTIIGTFLYVFELNWPSTHYWIND